MDKKAIEINLKYLRATRNGGLQQLQQLEETKKNLITQVAEVNTLIAGLEKELEPSKPSKKKK